MRGVAAANCSARSDHIDGLFILYLNIETCQIHHTKVLQWAVHTYSMNTKSFH